MSSSKNDAPALGTRPRPRRVESSRTRFRRLRRDDGYVMAMVGLLIVPLVIVTAFATDVGQWYAQATQMQRTADAAALAGVVWIGDKTNPTRYRDEALKVAAQNGFGQGTNVNGSTVSVNVEKVPPNRLRVTIDARAMVFFAPASGQTRQDLSRSAAAEFNLSVPLGSPRNYLGTGDLGSNAAGYAGTPQQREGMWMAISGYCTDKQQGDRIAAGFKSGGDNNNCATTVNDEYSNTSYEHYIELPVGRSYNTEVLIFNGNMSATPSCGVSGNNRTRESCPGGLDSKAIQPTTFTLYRADGTALDDTDNPTMASVGGCASNVAGVNGTKTFDGRLNSNGYVERNKLFNPGSGFAGSGTVMATDSATNGWWNMCTIPSGAPAGRYILRVRAQATTSGAPAQNNGSNAYSVVANRSNNTALCDSRFDAMCPKVFAKDYLSVFATPSGDPEFFLAEVGSEHAGKKVEITLWDPAEGATLIEIKRPTGCGGPGGGGTWANQTFDWQAGSDSGTGVSSIAVDSYDFNNKAVVITFRLPTSYNPAACNKWYRIRYQFNSGATDRTTWSLKILGDPVHLVA